MFSLYIHIPFCEKKCFYCSFVVSVGQQEKIDTYLKALQNEMKFYRDHSFHTIYIGGGTPSFLSCSQIHKLFQDLYNTFDLSQVKEITFEANPEGLDLDRARLLQELGVTRISLGVQSLKDKYLKSLGRCHDHQTAIRAFVNLRKAGLNNINLDLMYSFPQQTLRDVQDDLKAIVALGSEHVSLYALNLEPNSKFYTKKLKLDDEHKRADHYQSIVEFLKETVFSQYEVSNFSQPGYESLHNINYWTGGHYIGLGVGAHSHIDGRRFWNVSQLKMYLAKVLNHENPIIGEERLDPQKRLLELLLIGLRMNRGVQWLKLQEQLDCFLLDDKKALILEFIRDGFLIQNDGFLKATPRGRLILDELAARLI